MADNDYALVVAIQHYREGGPATLDGPINDAEDFVAWLTTIGAVPPNNVFPYVLKSDEAANSPKIHEIWELITTLTGPNPSQRTEKIGRRLYIFLAGHGVGEELDAGSLLTVETAGDIAEHLPGKVAAMVFRKFALFDEVVLFMDCCREWQGDLPDARDPYRRGRKAPGASAVKHVAGFSCEWGKVAREQVVNGRCNGLFSRALVDGLSGEAADVNGAVTTASLKAYLDHAVPSAGSMPLLKQKPHFVAQDPIVFADALAPKFATITVTLAGPTPVAIKSGNGFSDIPGLGITAKGPTRYEFRVPRYATYLLTIGIPGTAAYKAWPLEVKADELHVNV